MPDSAGKRNRRVVKARKAAAREERRVARRERRAARAAGPGVSPSAEPVVRWPTRDGGPLAEPADEPAAGLPP